MALTAVCGFSCSNPENLAYQSQLPSVTRTWIGPEFWANPLQDWQLNEGRIECVVSGGDRNVYLLTHEILPGGSFKMSVDLGSLESLPLSSGWAGLKLGVKGEFSDYRDSAVRGEGIPLGITNTGMLFIGDIPESSSSTIQEFEYLHLILEAESQNEHHYQLTLSIFTGDRSELLGQMVKDSISASWMEGGIALVSSAGTLPPFSFERTTKEYPDWGTEPDTQRQGSLRFWFQNLTLSGEGIMAYKDRKFGPILFNQFTLSNDQLKMTAQMAPVSLKSSKKVYFETFEDGTWVKLDSSAIDDASRTATFGPLPWDQSQERPYRLSYSYHGNNGDFEDHIYEGTIPVSPADKEELVLAAFTGNNDLGFPNQDLVANVKLQNPDFLFFSGDQIYEGVGGYGVQKQPLEAANLDYLRKWYLYGWAYSDLLRRIPSVAIPDDHDVYHGNIWGEGGKAADSADTESGKQDTGGYKMPAAWVNMVQKTQTEHLPEPFDATPVTQNIGVYYTNIEYGGISFAVLEDRKFKSAPKLLLLQAQVDNGWAQNPQFDPIDQGDHPDAKLLGQRQLEFLDHWTQTWQQDTWMKVVLSQTIFANLATLPQQESNHDRIVPKLRILKAGEYAPNDKPVADMDANGWPQTGRNNALEIIRKAYALHVAGDQHLGSTLQYGIDEFGDAGFALCVPSVSNVWPRRWYPSPSSQDPPYTGDFLDGFGNHMTVLAVSNPLFTGREPAKLYDRATGYGIVRFHRSSREIVLENWPRDADPREDDPYAGWPVSLFQQDNFNPPNGAWLPWIKGTGLKESLIQVRDIEGRHLQTIRVHADSVQLKVLTPGVYQVSITPMDEQETISLRLEAHKSSDNKVVNLE